MVIILEKQQIIELLHEKGLKATLQRQIICEYLFNTDEHPTAEQIMQKISEKYPTISIATIYSTLKNLKKKKIIHELEFSNKQPSHFEPNTQPHINLICPECHEILDYESETFTTFWDLIVQEINRTPERHVIDIYALCKKCKAKNKSN